MAISLKERFHFTGLSNLLIVGFITAIAISILNSIWSLYFNSFFNDISLVGFFSTILSLVALISFFIFIPIIEKYQENKIYYYSLVFSALLLVSFAFIKNFYFFVVLVILYVMMSVLRAESFGILYRNEAKIKVLGEKEGQIFGLSNLGWVIGGLLVIPLLKAYNVSDIFIFAAVFIFIAFVVLISYKKNIKKDGYVKINLFQDIKGFFKNKELFRLYIAGLGTPLWIGFIFVYMPLYIIKNNFDKSFVGVFLFVFLLPYLLEYFVGRKSDKVGTKKFIIIGYFFIGLLTILAYFSNRINLTLFLLVIASFGVALTGPTREIHFFKTIKKNQEEHYYGIYLTHLEVGLLLGKAIPAVLLGFFEFKFMFLVIGLIMFIFFLFSFKLKNI